jgi:hypothetical protein
MVDQQAQVLATLAQWWETQDRHREPMEQVLAKPAGINLGRQRAICRRDDADVHRPAAGASDWQDLAFLEGPKEFDLGRLGKFADLVEEERPSVGLGKVTLPACRCPCERPLFVSEQLRLDEFGRYGTTVDGHERILSSWAGAMNGAGK